MKDWEVVKKEVLVHRILVDTSLDRNKGAIYKDGDTLVFNKQPTNVEYKDCEYYHLHFTSDEVIKKGDWITSLIGFHPRICTGVQENQYLTVGDNNGVLKSNCRKVIGSTDPKIIQPTIMGHIQLPSPTDWFVIDYCNKGGIDKVLVDYHLAFGGKTMGTGKGRYITQTRELVPKINFSDNTLYINPIKTSWNKEEVVELLREFGHHINEKYDPIHPVVGEVTEFVKKHL